MIKVDGDWRNKSSIRFLNSCRAILFCHLRRQQFFLSSRSLRINEILRALIRSTFLSQLLITLLSSASIRYCLCLQITHINTAAKIQNKIHHLKLSIKPLQPPGAWLLPSVLLWSSPPSLSPVREQVWQHWLKLGIHGPHNSTKFPVTSCKHRIFQLDC